MVGGAKGFISGNAANEPQCNLQHGALQSPASDRMCMRAAPQTGGGMLRCVALVLLCAALSHAHRDKRAEMSPVPFVMGSRYGRSPERVMTPRNDRFFMGSRYGKRSEVLPVEEASRGEVRSSGCEGVLCPRLVCRYTGVVGLFKCVHPHKHLQFARRSSDDIGPGEEH